MGTKPSLTVLCHVIPAKEWTEGRCVAMELVIAASLSVMIIVSVAVPSSGQTVIMCRKKISCVVDSFRSWIRNESGRTGLGSNMVARNRSTET